LFRITDPTSGQDAPPRFRWLTLDEYEATWTCFGKVESFAMSHEEFDDTAATVREGI
jgi:hypothetical protein